MSLPWPDLTPEEWRERIAQSKKKKALTRPPDSSIIDLIDLGGPGSGNYGHKGRPGEVGGSGAGDGDDDDRSTHHLAPLIERIKQPDGGFTVHTTSGDIPTKGFALSLFKGRETVIPVKALSLADLVSFAKKNADLLSQDGHYFGAWHNPEDGNAYLDVSKIVQDATEAERLGRDHDQLAYFDLERGQSVDIQKVTDDEEDRVALSRAEIRRPYLRRLGEALYSVDGAGTHRAGATGRAGGVREGLDLGGEGSGNFGHAGRPGEVGGSASDDSGGGADSGASSDGPLLAKGPSARRGGKGANRALKVGMRVATEDDAERMEALKLPPQWKHVHLAESPTADLQATGIDEAGRTVYRFTAAHDARQSAEKFARGKEFNEAVPTLRTRIRHDMHDDTLSEKERESALMLDVIDKTAFRPGSEKETRAAKKAYGITTLEGRHVKVEGDKVRFRFRGKSGKLNAKTITDRTLAKELGPRVARTGPNQQLFPTASDQDLRDYLHSRDGDFKPKDFRTWHGTTTAMKKIETMKVPKTDAEFKKAQRVVAKAVAAHLGNTPAVALKSYIDPAVWAPWKVKKA